MLAFQEAAEGNWAAVVLFQQLSAVSLQCQRACQQCKQLNQAAQCSGRSMLPWQSLHNLLLFLL